MSGNYVYHATKEGKILVIKANRGAAKGRANPVGC